MKKPNGNCLKNKNKMKKLHSLFVPKLKEHMKIEIYVRTCRFLSFVGSTKRERLPSCGTASEGFVM